jgi:hypothetical protein
MRNLGSASRLGRAVACLLVAAVSTGNPVVLAQTSPTATPTPAAGYVPCTTFTTFEVHDGEVFARSTANPNDKGQEVRAGYAITFACGALPAVTATQAATSGLVAGGIVAGILAATGLGLGIAAATGDLGGGGGGGPAPPVTNFR